MNVLRISWIGNQRGGGRGPQAAAKTGSAFFSSTTNRGEWSHVANQKVLQYQAESSRECAQESPGDSQGLVAGPDLAARSAEVGHFHRGRRADRKERAEPVRGIRVRRK